jgi:DNA-binding response OmpR family regulator
MPGMDGLEVTRRLRAAPETRPIPVIALAARPVLGDRERAIQAGCDEYETRPLDLPRLLAKIEALLWKPAAPEPASADGDTFVLPLRPTKPPRPAEQARPAPPSPGPG